MKRYILLCLAALVPSVSAALTKPEILTREREFTAIVWDLDANGDGQFQVADTMISMHDEPSRRFRRSGVDPLKSPVAKWFIDHNVDFLTSISGVNYAMGARETPTEAIAWMGTHVNKPVGLSGEQFVALVNAHIITSNNWSGNDDCVGVAGYGTDWPFRISSGTGEMQTDAASWNGYYKRLCRLSNSDDCSAGEYNTWQPAEGGDLLVIHETFPLPHNNKRHVATVVELGGTSTMVIECTGNNEIEGTAEHPWPFA
jgi:hypothetical protein